MIKTHEVYYPMYTNEDKFIILVTGGRGSGKSFGTSSFIERLTFDYNPDYNGNKVVHNVLYCRYTMTSAHISVIPEFLDKIELDGTSAYFKPTKTDVQNLVTGSRIMFRGIKTSSGNQTAKLKSIHGVTVFVCDEAEEWTSEEEYDKIMLSIRQKGLKNLVIIIMNPTDSNHMIYQKYIKDTHKIEYFDGVPVQISTHPNVLHIHTTYLDNLEHLSDEFLREMEDMKQNNPEKYAHIAMGQWSDVAEGAVFKKWGIVDEFPQWCKKVAIGLDFGYSHDPTAAVRCGIIDNRIYLDEIDYRTGLLASDIIKKLRPYNLKVIADSADPRLIQEIHNGGVRIYPVEKGAGSIIAGIEKMKEYEIYVTKRSYNLQNELRNYIWAKDKDGRYINEPEDHDNHLADAARYYVLGELLGKIQAPKNYTNVFAH
ncbi:MAG: phage terminase large subunit [Lachnospiraceae bacterium]|nr:phage terminase large subunit [Lachnospiraceae bacterium]MBO5407459.1 phage terminase large subunit [Bacteroidales bacterium]